MLRHLPSIRKDIAASLQQGEQALDRLFSETPKHFDVNDMLVKAGQAHDFVYKLRSGWAARIRHLENGRAQIILLFLPGDIFALKSLFLRHHPDDIQALTPVEVDHLHVKTLRPVFERDVDVATRCMAQVVEEERRLHNDIVALGSGTAAQRLAVFLLRVRERLIRGNAIEQESWRFELPLTQLQISDHLGLSLVHTNKTLMKLRDRKLVAFARRHVTILDVPGLLELGHALLDPDEQQGSILVA